MQQVLQPPILKSKPLYSVAIFLNRISQPLGQDKKVAKKHNVICNPSPSGITSPTSSHISMHLSRSPKTLLIVLLKQYISSWLKKKSKYSVEITGKWICESKKNESRHFCQCPAPRKNSSPGFNHQNPYWGKLLIPQPTFLTKNCSPEERDGQNYMLNSIYSSLYATRSDLNTLSASIKKIAGNLPTNCLSVFDHFAGLSLEGLNEPNLFKVTEKTYETMCINFGLFKLRKSSKNID